ncbi:MAG TPA: DUF5683 domain-containing protein [Calditrichia bacterium]|nr:hypothetical protein [Calditrichota bacterium]HQU70988.1 DUF5683 domain-containing protein [Calditrichia bacterium]HQV30430.1 DUF5683 domain-containing protein [Calditrichia bacterium]
MGNRVASFLGVLFVLVLMPRAALAQQEKMPETHTAVLDTARLLSDEPLKSPRGAILRSAVLPGWGQWYNEKRWKALLVLGVNATLAGTSWHYHQRWADSNDAGTPDKSLRDRRNTYNWYFGLSYLLTMADAYVDAYLFKFDEAMDISLVGNPGQQEGWQVALHFHF